MAFLNVNTNFNLNYRENTLSAAKNSAETALFSANIAEDLNNNLTQKTFRQGLIT